MNGIAFTKMHGLGNDFVVIDTRTTPVAVDRDRARAIADRRTGVGCDQLILIEPPTSQAAQAFMRIHNADGGEVAACGNATRCVAALLMAETGSDTIAIETNAGILHATPHGDRSITVDMGPSATAWDQIPLAAPMDTLHVDACAGPLRDAVAVGMGNPHAVYFVAEADEVDVATYGRALELHPMFPEHANIGVAQILPADKVERIRLRVWERGVGLTRACGTGACAALVAAHRRGLTGRQAVVTLDGGDLDITWAQDGHVHMTGPYDTSFQGRLDPTLLAS